MGSLVEQSIKTIFQGVSRQSDTVRLPGQVEEMTNALPSVVTGGFEKRPPTQHLNTLAGVSTSTSPAIHAYVRDATEQYLVIVPGDGTMKVFDALTGTEKTVNTISGAVATYLTGTPSTDFAFITVADYTFVVNRTKVTALATATTGTITGYKTNFSDLDSVTGTVGQIYGITGAATELDNYWVTWDTTTLKWKECADPNGQNSFDKSTMPHKIIRNGDGTFTVSQIDWNDRIVGDNTTCPAPSFIGSKIKDVFFHRNRLGVVADEHVCLTQSGDFFNWFPSKSTQVLDTDPIDMNATTSKVSLLNWAIPFRRSVFMTSDKTQFDLSGEGKLTPATAAVDFSTTYDASSVCRPVALGDTLYFAADSNKGVVVWEYFWNDVNLSNTAEDITKHAQGYISGVVKQMTSSAAHDKLFLLDSAATDSIYHYTAYWSGAKKAQSAWGKYTFDNATVYSVTALSEWVYVVLKRGSQITLERFSVEREQLGTLPFVVMLDRRVSLTGSYDAGTNTTTWTTPYTHSDDPVVVLGGDFAAGMQGRQLNVTYPSSTTVAATGDFSAAPAYVGVPYTMLVTLSKQYLRQQDNSSVITGRLQMRQMTLSYADTGYFEVDVTPVSRDPLTYRMPGRVLGSASTQVGAATIAPGFFKFPVRSRADTVSITVNNDSHLPCVINGATWLAFYNDVARGA